MKALPLIVSCLLTVIALPAAADPWKDESGHGRGHGDWKQAHKKQDRGYDDWKYDARYDDRWRREGEHRRRPAAPADAAIGGAIGGALGGALGAELGGREGAIVGAGVGAAVGTAVATREQERRARVHYCFEERTDASGGTYRVELDPQACQI